VFNPLLGSAKFDGDSALLMSGSKSKSDGKKRILVVDDHPLVRDGLIQLIRRQSGLTCCGEADTVLNAQEAVLSEKPDLVILDLRLDKGDGLELIKTFKSQLPALRMLVLSQLDEVLYAERVLKAGAHGYLMKEEAAKEVVNAIRTVLAGQLYVSPKISGLVLRKMIDSSAVRPVNGVESLTDRELQIFQMLGAGKSTRRIAAELFLSFKTVETHRENIKAKMGFADATTLIHQATLWYRRGDLEVRASPAPN
jgi:DNA-binding NarL/FixJ family response regulator